MNQKILITGQPRCGKSTLISKLIDYYTNEKKLTTYGFLTPEIKERGNRIGFDILDIYSGNRSRLARLVDCNTGYQVGKYCVFVKEFENYIENSLILEDNKIDLYVIDEIGKMELFSKKFQNLIKKIFTSRIPAISTIGLKLNHPIKKYLLNLPSILLLDLNRRNSQLIFEKVISLIS